MRCSLALLLAFSFGLCHTSDHSSSLLTAQQAGVGENVGEVGIKSTATAWGEDSVGMVDVCSGEILDGGLEGCKSNNDLGEGISNDFGSIDYRESQRGSKRLTTTSHLLQLKYDVLGKLSVICSEVWTQVDGV